MPASRRRIDEEFIDMEVARWTTTALEIGTGIMGGIALRAAAERKPFKAAITGAVSVGLGTLAFHSSIEHEDAALRFGHLQAMQEAERQASKQIALEAAIARPFPID